MKKKINIKDQINAVMFTTPEVRTLYLDYIEYVDHVVDVYDEFFVEESELPPTIRDKKTIRKVLELRRDCLIGIRTIKHLEDSLFSGDISHFKKLSKRYLSGYSRFHKNMNAVAERIDRILIKIRESRGSVEEMESD